MNINDLQREIEILKSVTPPPDLKAQIITKINQQKTTNNMKKKIIGFGIPVLVAGAIAIGTFMVPQTANAHSIHRVKAAFESVKSYHTISYTIKNNDRVRTSESWTDDGKRTTFKVNEDGTLTKLEGNEIKFISERLLDLSLLSPEEIADPDRLEATLVINLSGFVGQISGQSGQEVQILGTNGEEIQTLNPEQVLIMSPLTFAEMSLDFLSKLLQKSDMWEKKVGQIFRGKMLDQYKLKDEYINFSVYVDPNTKLPLHTLQEIEMDGEKTITEVEFDYWGTTPPAK